MKEAEIRNPDLMDRYVELVQEDVKRLFDGDRFVRVECPACGEQRRGLEFTKMGFSYVTCPKLCSFELFEHLYSPKAFLNKIYTLLKKGGYLYFTTLNGKGFDIQLLWERHNNVNPPHHLNFCNPDAMKTLLNTCGFEVISLATPGKLDWDIVEQRMNRDHISIGRFWNSIVKADEKTKVELQEWIQNNGLSSHMRIIAQKG